MQFWGFSLLQRHCVFLPGGDFFHAILGLLCPSKFVAAVRRKRSQKNHFLSVSEVTLGMVGVQFWRFSVLQRHGVSLPGGDFVHGVFPSEDQQQQQQKPLQQQEEKVARMHSSSKREKKQLKASFHHHFLWVSEVTLGIFEVNFGCFSVLQRHGVLLPGGDFFHGVFPFGDRR